MYNVKNILRELINKVVDLENRMYPVGSIYMSVNNVNPSTYFGGTWIQWGSGKVPVGVNTDETEFATVEKSGGAKTHTLTTGQIPSHTHTYDKANANTGSHTLTASQLPKISGTCNFRRWGTSGQGDIIASTSGICSTDSVSQENVPCASGSSAQNTTTRLKINFGGGTGHTHSISTTSTASGGLSNAGNAHNNLQPYITCYMWKRTA